MARSNRPNPRAKARRRPLQAAADDDRAQLRRQLREQREIVKLSRQLERAIYKSDSALLGLFMQLQARNDAAAARAELTKEDRPSRATERNPFDELPSSAEREVETV
jgi:hypothetical protein